MVDRHFELAENLFVQAGPCLAGGYARQAKMGGQRGAQQHATVGKRQHANQLPVVDAEATRHQVHRFHDVLSRHRGGANVVRHLVVIGLDLLDHQDQPGVVERLAKVAQLADIVHPLAVVTDHYYA
ncbi:hypothetical protein D3C73_1216550 [compost metagenome]